MLDLSKICIKSTKDYGIFKRALGNRAVSEDNVKRLAKSIGENHLASIGIVNSKNEVIDGQHRLEVCKLLGIPFNYIVMEDYGIEEVHILNANGSNWNNDDYIKQFAERFRNGEVIFKNYERVLETSENMDVDLQVAIVIGNNGHRNGSQPIRDGLLTFTATDDELLDNAEDHADLFNIIGKRLLSKSFFSAYLLVKHSNSNFKTASFQRKVKRALEDIADCKNTVPAFIDLVEDIYNYKISDANRISLSPLAKKAYAKGIKG